VKKTGRPRLYPWNSWFRRKRFALRRGRDYHCNPYSMGQQIRNAAFRRGLKVAIEIASDDRFVVTVLNGY